MDSYFERKINGPPFSENEDKKYEFCRLNSFKQWPKESHVFPLKLSKAGFYFTGKGDEVQCFECGTKKNEWKLGDDPFEIHKIINPNCPFVTENSSANVPFQCSVEDTSYIQRLNSILGDLQNETSNSNVGELNESTYTSNESAGVGETRHLSDENQQALHSTTEYKKHQQQPQILNVADSARVLSIAGVSATVKETGEVKEVRTNTRNNKQSMDITAQQNDDFSQTSDTNRDYDIPPPTGESIGPLRFERNRLETFKNWPTTACVSATELAKQGFFYTGSADRVQCIFCKGILRNWEVGDRPHIEHRKHFPRCPFVLGMNIGNVPLPLDQNSSHSPVAGSTRFSNKSVADSLCTGNSGHAARLGIITDRPKHPQYAIESQRLSSFQGWPPYKHQTPQQLAEAGFWYAGFNDNVKCFYCDGGLRNWDPVDDPWVEHAKWFPRCPFVVQVKGQEFINRILAENGGEIRIPGFENPTSGLPGQSTGNFNVEEREIRARMDSPYVRKLIDNNIDRDLIMRTIRRRLRQTGDDFPSCTALVEAVYALEAEEKAHSEEQTTNDLSAVTQPLSYPGENEEGTESARQDNGRDDMACTPKMGEEVKSGDQLEDHSSNKEDDDLRRENMELKEQRLCKICMTNDANVVFLPCGHLLSCAACAPALTQCPICRASIKGTIRTYIA